MKYPDISQVIEYLYSLESSCSINFSSLQILIIEGVWRGMTYQKIADELSYEVNYIKQVASRLWKSLSSAIGEKISKSNLHKVISKQMIMS